MTTHHASFTIKRTYEAPASRVFAAWSDPVARARWGVPKGDGIEYLQTEFRVGGRDISKCGPAGDLSYYVEETYHDIVPDRRIVFAETIDHEGERLAVTLMSIEFGDAGVRTRLVLTAHVVGLDSSDMIEGSQSGWNEVLDNLTEELQRTPAPA